MFFRSATFSDNTKRSYHTYQKSYQTFCNLLNIAVVPASTSSLCLYAAYLARFLLPQSVCPYINFVGLLHKELGYPNPLSDNWVVSSVLRGIKRTLGVPPKPRLPVTVSLLVGIRSRLNLNCSKHASFWAICLVAFFGLFRKAHLLPESESGFNPKKMFTRSDFSALPTVFTSLLGGVRLSRWDSVQSLFLCWLFLHLLCAQSLLFCMLTTSILCLSTYVIFLPRHTFLP